MPENSDRLTHLDDAGRAHIVDVSEKAVTAREATATSCVRMQAATLNAIVGGDTPKGDVMAVARIAGIQAAKKVLRVDSAYATRCLCPRSKSIWSRRPHLPGVRIEATLQGNGSDGGGDGGADRGVGRGT